MVATPIKIAILAMGGEGGGVLADWIVDLAEYNGFCAQMTSVPGVAQRTGATIYYVELFPVAPGGERDEPVLALMPLPGDVDIVVASELMEAARAVQRGLVTPDRTTLVCSTHRVYAIAERIAPGDGRVDATSLLGHAQAAARRFVGFDMAQLAHASGSVISAVLFGALAAAGVLPFARAQFEATIERGGIGVASSRGGFAAGFDGPRAEAPAPPTAPVAPRDARGRALVARIDNRHPAAARALLVEGVRRLVDYQDFDYATLYLDRVERAMQRHADDGLHAELARHLALWMSYEDTIRVADLKTRDTRLRRVRDEVDARDRHVLAIHEYLHPRVEEVGDTLPAGLGAWLLRTAWARRLVERLVSRGRVVRTNSVRGYLLLSAIAGLRRWRRGTLRYRVENERIEAWLREVEQAASAALAIEIVRCQRLIKGYGATHERGWGSFQRIRGAWQRAGRDLAPATLRALAEAALADEEGGCLDEALAGVVRSDRS
ncbi:MAG TPA: indolepyruvate oxidoreductase subunit beta family protein [Burkholderiaceae bacterium]|nr:indolepyruvate oxidoreductase subunit beta family protein [Burkholderiaceae bacterium]